MLKNSQKKKEFECKIEYLMKNSCSRCPQNRICEESDKYDRDTSRQDKELSDAGLQERKSLISKKRI